MFINEQYLFNQHFTIAYLNAMEITYFELGVCDAATLFVMMVGA